MRPATGNNGSSGIDQAAIANTIDLPSQGRWNESFKDSYVSIPCEEVPLRTPINEIVQRIAAIAKTATRENAGRMAVPDGEVV